MSTKPCVVHQVYGPPGTGKTHHLATEIKKKVAQYGPDAISVMSFSVTAAEAIGGRDTGLPKRSIGTIHSMAYRSIGGEGTTVALDPKVLAEWNGQVGHGWKVTPDARRTAQNVAESNGGMIGKARTGDELLAQLDRARAMRIKPADYPPDLTAFDMNWKAWKLDVGAVDFSDMIVMALERALDGERAPGNPWSIVVDESQDCTTLEMDLLLAWGANTQSVMFAGDDDQAIGVWRGANPEKLLRLGSDGDGVQLGTVHELQESRRIPAAVKRVAEQWVRRLSLRREKIYRPRTKDKSGADLGYAPEGAAFALGESLADPGLVNKLAVEIEAGRSVMVVASCSYMLDPLVKNLREAGVPFANRYRPTESRWNPLGTGEGMSTAEKVYRFLVLDDRLGDRQRLWTGDDVRAWIQLLDVKRAGLRRGAKANADALPDGAVPWEDVRDLFVDEAALERATAPDLAWFSESILNSRVQTASYPLQVARKNGPAALAEAPLLTVGTVHSVKGAQADVVYVSPDISGSALASLNAPGGRDQMIRLFYVAMTRSFEELRLLAPSTGTFLKQSELLPPELEVLP